MPTDESFRRAVMDELDDVYEQTDGTTPDHIIVSEAIWADMTPERLSEPSIAGKTLGFMGMCVWRSNVLDEGEQDALLLSEDVFFSMFDESEDL